MTKTSRVDQNPATLGFALRNESKRVSFLISNKYSQLGVLLAAYILSNVFRTLPAILAPSITHEYSLSLQSAGYFLSAFNFAFGSMQLFVGVAIDRFGAERTVAVLLIFATVGSLLSCFATSFAVLLVGQVLMGVGCSAIFLGCLVFLARNFEAKHFATLSGFVLGLGGVGMLLTATPLAILIDAWSWRSAFVVISIAAALVTASCLLLPKHPAASVPQSETLTCAFRLLKTLLKLRGTLGILLMGGVGYAAMIAVRGFWIVPLLTERQGLSLVQSGNVVLLLSVGMILSPLLFGLVDPGEKRRRHLIVASALVMSAAICWLGISYSERLFHTVAAIAVIGAVSGFTILQYADVRSSFEPEVIGRALSLLNMSVFIGAAIVQLIAGAVSDSAASLGLNSLECVFLSLASLVIFGCLAFSLLPSPKRPHQEI